MRRRKKNLPNILFHLALIFELAVFQFAWPLAIARAEEAPAETPVAEAQKEKEEKTGVLKNNKTGENADESEKLDETENIEEPEENPEDFWKSCNLTKNESDIIKKNDCKECRKKTSCEKIKACLSVFIDVKNEADIGNKITTESETGGNSIDLNEPTEPRETRNTAATRSREDRQNSDEIDAENVTEQEATPISEQLAADLNLPSAQTESADPETEKEDLNESGEDQSGEDEYEKKNAQSDKEEEDEIKKDTAEIATGDAIAVTNIVNEVNMNIIGGNGIATVENIYGDQEGDINLLENFNSLLENAQNINDGNSSAFDVLEISIENEADIENDVITTANTGENEIDNEAENGDSLITTGDAIAVANVANVVNNNIIGNNFLFTVINIFGNWLGNLIVPGEGLLTVPASGESTNLIVDVQNETNIENIVETEANTGGNLIESEGGAAVIQTGDSTAASVVTNQVGSTTIADNWFFLAINNMGNWVGNVLNWNSEKNDYETVFSFDFDEEEESGDGGISGWLTKIFVKNEADIENNVETSANTGANEIESEGGSANISTGNAYAFSKIYNLVNNNFIGNNWMFAVVNIFGSWKGDIEFAYPDLSVSLAGSAGKVKKGDSYSYNVTVRNNGRADGENVQVALALPEYVLYQNSGKRDAWNIGELKVGEERIFRVDVTLDSNLPAGTMYLESQAAVATDTKEIELDNNVSSNKIEIYDDSVAVDSGDGSSGPEGQVDNAESAGGGESSQTKENSALYVTRSVSKMKIEVGQIVKHTIVAQNTGTTTLKNVVVNDKVKNKNGDAGDYSWDVEKLEPGKKAVVTYKMMVNLGAPTGDYRNNSIAWGYDENTDEIRSNEAGVKIAVGDAANKESENYYYTYYTYSGPESAITIVENGSSFIEAAEAATDEFPGKVMGGWTNGVCHKLPWWGWLAAAIVYFTAIHWALLRQREIIKPVKDK